MGTNVSDFGQALRNDIVYFERAGTRLAQILVSDEERQGHKTVNSNRTALRIHPDDWAALLKDPEMADAIVVSDGPRHVRYRVLGVPVIT